MATVTVEINGRPYNVGCADGQEERVRALARQFDDNVRQVAQDVGHVGDIRLFLMAALLVADELSDIRTQLNRLRAEHDRTMAGSETVEKRAADALNAAAGRLEKLLAE
ncbi:MULTISPECIES: cell division protein ZapA [unclassified Caulobacter]|uniref:cell division protein ZapA n=1 Tax=unclassified Caulobacter TaxID=2648921 RepID=UPI0013C852F2|nr:cell division protein ZapA [Caulobacter sp. 17J80-11]NEX91629.1 cell division protein ZapA [Caulobacter sp. 17J65-9]